MATGLRLDIENLTEVANGLGIFGKELEDAMQRALQGEGGEAILREMRMGMSSHVDTGRTLQDLKVRHAPDGGTTIGVGRDRFHIGTWIESGTQPHEINPKARLSTGRLGRLKIGTGFSDHVMHPGTKRYRIAGKALRTAQWEVESAILDEFDRVKDGASMGSGQ